MSFLKGLNQLEELILVEIPFTNGDEVLNLPSTTNVSIDYTNITDYSNLQYASNIDSTIEHELIITEEQSYEENENGIKTRINTGIKIPNDSKNLRVIVDSKRSLESYEIINNILYLNVIGNEFTTYNIINWETGLREIPVTGFQFAVYYTTSTNIDIRYPLNIASIKDTVTFTLEIDDDITHKTDRIVVDLKEGNSKIPTDEDFGLVNYTITGWYYDKELLNQVNFEEPFTKNTVLYGKTEAIIDEMYSVIFNSNGGTEVETLNDIKKDSLISKPIDPTLEGYTFKGWFKDEALTREWNFEQDIVNENIELFASWTPNYIEPVEPVNPDTPTDPVDPVAPSNPIESTDPDSPSNPTLPNTGINSVFINTGVIFLFSGVVIIQLKRKIKAIK